VRLAYARGRVHTLPVLRVLLLTAAVTLAAAAPAAASTTLAIDGGLTRPEPYQTWVDAANVPTPDGVVTLRLTSCDEAGALGCVTHSGRVIEIDPEWLRPQILLHELGHIFDDEMPAWGRDAFEALLRRHDPWSGPTENNAPDEQFAEAYALCARHPRIRAQYVAGYHYSPTPGRHRRVCALIRQLGAYDPVSP
jgi:hypothetical protein